MNKIIVSDDRSGYLSRKLCAISPGSYNIGDIVEVQEGKDSSLAVIIERNYDLSTSTDGCSTCVFSNQDLCNNIPCGYVTSDGYFPCVALNKGKCIMFESVARILEDL